MKMMKLLLSALVAAVSLGLVAGTPTGISVNGTSVGDNTSGDGWSYGDHTLKLTGSGKTYTLTGTDTTRELGVKVTAGTCTIIANNLHLDCRGNTLDEDWAKEQGAIYLVGEVNCDFRFQGENSLHSGWGYAGFEVQSEASVSITNIGTASLSVIGGKYGAGIGGARTTRQPGAITINCDENGTIDARGLLGAGIGGGMFLSLDEQSGVYKGNVYRGGDCNQPIVINGGNITATGDGGSAGIGGGGSHYEAGGKVYFDHLGGSFSMIRISGGRVTAVGSEAKGDGSAIGWRSGCFSAAIGAGCNAKKAGVVRVEGGTVIATFPGDGWHKDMRALCNGMGVKEPGWTRIVGGTLYFPMHEQLKGTSAVPLDNPLDNDGKSVREWLCCGFEPNAKVEIDGIIDLDALNTPTFGRTSYGLNDLYADDQGRLHLYFPDDVNYMFSYDWREYALNGDVWCNVAITFDAGEGTFADGSNEKIELVDWMSTFDDVEIPVPTRPNYVFMGWMDASGAKLVKGETQAQYNWTYNALWGYNYAPKVVVDGTTLRFVYDGVDYAAEGKTFYSVLDAQRLPPDQMPPWVEDIGNVGIRKVVIDPSFKQYKPQHCAYWFKFQWLESIEGLSNLDTSNVTDMRGMFMWSQVDYLNLSDLNTSNVTNMQDMFFQCFSLKELYPSRFDTSKVRNMGSMFSQCRSLQKLDVSRFSTENVTDFSYMFRDCIGLRKLDLSSFDTRRAVNVSHMFSGCLAETIYATTKFDVSGVTLSAGMWEAREETCSYLRVHGDRVTGWRQDNPKDKTYARLDGDGDEPPGYFSRLPVAVVEDNGETLRFCAEDDVPSGTKGVDWFSVPEAEEISFPVYPDWWEQCAATCRRVVFDESLAYYKPTSLSRWFAGFSRLEEIVGLENLFTQNVVSYSEMFSGCSSLTEIDLGGFCMDAPLYLAKMFAGCSSLTTIREPSFMYLEECLENGDRGSDMFYGCHELVGGNGTAWSPDRTSATYAVADSLETPGYFTATPTAVVVYVGGNSNELRFYCDSRDHRDEGTVHELGNGAFDDNPPWCGQYVSRAVFDASFANCRPTSCARWFRGTSLSAIVGVSYLDVTCVTDFSEMFAGCEWLTRLDLSHFDTVAATRMTDMFSGCTRLKKIVATDAFVTDPFAGVQSMFDGCTALVGGAGFAYDAAKTDGTYARIDTAESEGYFTALQPVPVAVLNADAGTMTFYCDYEEHADEGEVYFIEKQQMEYEQYSAVNPSWYNNSDKKNVTTVIFDPSFADCRPVTCRNWFNQFENLTEIQGLEYLDVSEAESMYGMFLYCNSIGTLDLTCFDTQNVTDMRNMFGQCVSLTTVYVSSSFVTTSVDVGSNYSVFESCTNLVGGAGTSCAERYRNDNSNYRSVIYAQIDGGTDDPGYFTARNVEPRAVLSGDGATLTFYWDSVDHTGEGAVYNVAHAMNPAEMPPWNAFVNDTVTTVVFDRSFAKYRPTSCGRWFEGFVALEAVEGIENLDVSEATSLRNMFASCSSLTALDLSGFDTANVRDMGGFLSGCSGLGTIDVLPLDTASVTNMAWMFASTAVTELDLWTFDTAQVSDMEGMFSGNAALRKILVSQRFTAAKAAASEDVFAGDVSLVGGAGTAYDAEHVGADYARVDAPDASGYLTMKTTAKAVISSDERNLTFYYDNLTHEDEGTVYEVPETVSDISGRNCPWNNTASLSTVKRAVIDESFAAFRPTCCAYWFYNMQELRDISGLEYLDVSEATHFNCMFAYCPQLCELHVESFDTRKATCMLSMFKGCSGLVRIYVSELFRTTALTWPDEPVFGGNTALVGGAGTEFDAEHVTSEYARIDSSETPGYFSYGTVRESYEAWAKKNGLTGADAAWDATPALWGGTLHNALVYTFGEGIADGSTPLLNIEMGADGKPMITLPPEVKGHSPFFYKVIGSKFLDDWEDAFRLECNNWIWTLPAGTEANFFRVWLTEY